MLLNCPLVSKTVYCVFRDSEPLDEDTIQSQLIIPSLHPADRGLYTCTANNFLGNSSTSVFNWMWSLRKARCPHSSGLPCCHLWGKCLHRISVLSRADSLWHHNRVACCDRQSSWNLVLYPFWPIWHTQEGADIYWAGYYTYSLADLLPVTKYESVLR